MQPMRMIFEVQDLAVASPATVSRCGMVYLEPSILGLDPFVHCWLKTIPEAIKPNRDTLKSLFTAFLEVRTLDMSLLLVNKFIHCVPAVLLSYIYKKLLVNQFSQCLSSCLFVLFMFNCLSVYSLCLCFSHQLSLYELTVRKLHQRWIAT